MAQKALETSVRELTNIVTDLTSKVETLNSTVNELKAIIMKDMEVIRELKSAGGTSQKISPEKTTAGVTTPPAPRQPVPEVRHLPIASAIANIVSNLPKRSDARNMLLQFFNRPMEPCFMPKGKAKVVLDIPEHYYPDKYKKLFSRLSSRLRQLIGSLQVSIRTLSQSALPDLCLPMKLPFYDHFSLFVPKHREMAGKLIDIFMGATDVEDLVSLCSYCQLRINPGMFNYCLSVAILHRPDTNRLNFPTFLETFPDKFFNGKVVRRAREISHITPDGPRRIITIPPNLTASDIEPEQCVAYFREDIGINLHHWHWHLVYPFAATDIAIVAKDRRGELFYYMHHQVIARYNIERMCNGLRRVKSFSNFREPIAEGYFSKLKSKVTSHTLAPRYADSKIQDLARPVDKLDIEVHQLETWRDRFVTAVKEHSILMPHDQHLALDEETGIDILGNLLEASILSKNASYYGDLHNMGHSFFALVHDPDHRHLELSSVMGDTATAMRDPVFYRWHAYIDDLFYIYKDKLPPYGTDRLDFPGIQVTSISIKSPAPHNVLETYWEWSIVDLDLGLDFTSQGTILTRFTHLQHQEYDYVIKVNNTSGQSQMATFRIFMAPTADEDGQPLPFDEQRKLMIEMDKFTRQLSPGNNRVVQSSLNASVTISYERMFRNQNARPGEPGSKEASDFDFCGCGWPQHMLLPKGTAEGYSMVLFVMVSDWNNDKVEQHQPTTCCDAASFCGLRDRKYPDRQAMGFPFDRSSSSASTLKDFLRPNMGVLNCTIKYKDVTIDRKSREQ